jgi:hypothetical protein
MKKIFFSLTRIAAVPSLFVVLAFAGVASAANVVTPSPTLITSADNIAPALLCPIIDIMFWVLISISIIMVLWAAYLYATSEGDAEKPSQARKMVLYAAVGIVIALIARGFPAIIFSLFPTSGTFSSTWACHGY